MERYKEPNGEDKSFLDHLIPKPDVRGRPEQTVNMNNIKVNKGPTLIKKVPAALVGVWWIIEVIVSVIIMIIVIRAFVFQTYEVFGSSMSPTLSEQDRLIVFKLGKVTSNLFGEYVPKRGEIVVFDSPKNDNLQLVKRVIALPGERIVIESGEITVFNEEFPDGFDPDLEFVDTLSYPKTGNVDLTVPEGEIFVAGDNRATGKSLDSRNDLGTIPVENVVGDLIFRHVPLSDAGTF